MKSFEYKVSVIIPVYNAEKYLRNCLDSLLKQTISQDEIEVLMINDGSSDNSLAICNEYTAKYKNFKVFSQENKGVSAARNAGIKTAKGKYLLFLDSDDMLSSETIKNVVDFFDQYYDEIDIVTYNLSYLKQDGKKTKHYRSDILTETGIYDVQITRYIHLTTMNVVVKNEKVYFDETRIFHEDELYIAEWVMRRQKYGFVKEAEYLYVQYGDSTISTKQNPYYIFEQSMYLYEYLFEKYKDEYGNVAPYIQELVLNDFNWKLKSDNLYPYHYLDEDLKKAKERVSALVNKISTEFILNHPTIDLAHKYFFIGLKTSNCPFVKINRDYLSQKNQFVILDEYGTLRREDTVLIVINQLKIKNDRLYLLAYLKNFAFAFLSKPILYVVCDNKDYIEVPLFNSQYSNYWTEIHTNTFWAFHLDLDLNKVNNFRFIVDYEGAQFNTSFYFSNRQALQPKREREYLLGERYAVLQKNNSFLVKAVDNRQVIKAKKSFENNLLKKNIKQWLVRQYTKKRNNKKIWLYRDSFNSKDNAYYQFKHDFNKNDGIERYYILNKDNVEWENWFTENEKKYLIEFGSRKHKKLFIQADKILTSFIDRSVLVPFDAKTIEYYWDMFNFEVIYLQHGVMHAKIPNMYSKEKIYMVDKVVVSTQFEKANLQKELGFREQDIICTGMPRLDCLEKRKVKRKILFAPSWRLYLVNKDNKGHWCAKSNFVQTDYFKEVSSFLTSEKLKRVLEENDYVLDIKLHPNFQIYNDEFETVANERIKVVNDGDIGEYALCLTDFSSFMYECMYLDIPVILHIFDKEKFKAGLHSYREFFWDLENYPYYAKSDIDIVYMIERFLKNQDEIQTAYKDYVSGFYLSRENNHAEELYCQLTGYSIINR